MSEEKAGIVSYIGRLTSTVIYAMKGLRNRFLILCGIPTEERRIEVKTMPDRRLLLGALELAN